jgi:hypothetical protein
LFFPPLAAFLMFPIPAGILRNREVMSRNEHARPVRARQA